MQSGSIDHKLPVPLYHQIALLLKHRIKAGDYESGVCLPPEHVLAEEFGVSRITVARALKGLVSDGLVRRRRGAGTEVTYKPAGEGSSSNLAHLMQTVEELGSRTQATVLKFEYILPSKVVAEELGLAEGQQVQRAVRVRRFDTVPFSYLISYVPEEIGRTFNRSDLECTALHRLFELRGHRFTSTVQHVSAVLSDAHLSTALDVSIGSPLLKIERTVRDQHGQGIQFLEAWYVSERYRHTIRLSNVQADAPGASPQEQTE